MNKKKCFNSVFLGGIAFSRVGNCTELGENLDRVRGKLVFSLFRWFFDCVLRVDDERLGDGKRLNVSCPLGAV